MDSEVLRDLLDRDSGLATPRDAHDVITELIGIRLGHGGHPFQAAPQGKPDQMSPIGAAVPGARVVVDTSFWARASRDGYRDILAPLGVEPVVYYMSTSRKVSLERLERRQNTGPNDVVVPADRAIAYIGGFEKPTPGEGPVRVIRTGPERGGNQGLDPWEWTR